MSIEEPNSESFESFGQIISDPNHVEEVSFIFKHIKFTLIASFFIYKKLLCFCLLRKYLGHSFSFKLKKIRLIFNEFFKCLCRILF
jgi:hypothetical protein